LQILDVRTPSEWNQGHVAGAHHIFLPHLHDKIADLDREKPIAVYCDSGYRAGIAASILKQQGFKCVCNIPGSWQAWRKAGFPIEKSFL
jgi:hydroxyacylglutathione hydrolase